MARRLRSFASVAPLLCAAVMTACISKPGPPVVTDEMRAAFGEVAVVPCDAFCVVGVNPGTVGGSAGTDAGFRRGTRALWEWPVGVLGAGARGAGGGGGGGGVGMLVYGAAVVAATAGAFVAAVIYVPVSTAAGGLSAIPEDEAKAAQAVLVATAQEFESAAPIAATVADGARLRRGRDVVAPDAADTIVRISVESIRRGDMQNWLSYDRPFAIETQARATLIRQETVLWTREYTSHDAEFEARRSSVAEWRSSVRRRSYLEWADDDGVPLRTELDLQFAVYAALITDDVFGPPPAPRATR